MLASIDKQRCVVKPLQRTINGKRANTCTGRMHILLTPHGLELRRHLISTLQQAGAALGVAAIGILFGSALAGGMNPSEQQELYANAFVWGMSYNLVAASLASALLFTLRETNS